MKSFARIALCSVSVAALAGCASTEVTESQSYQGERLTRPDRIIVHDLAATAADIPAWSAAADRHAPLSTPQTPEAIETGIAIGLADGTTLTGHYVRIGRVVVHVSPIRCIHNLNFPVAGNEY